MIRNLLPLLLSLIIGTTLSAQADCEASFLAFPAPNSGSVFHFEAQVLEGVAPFTYHWDFGDDNTDSNPIVDHAFEDNGTYMVCLSITDANGCSNTYSNYIDVYIAECTEYVIDAGIDGLGNLFGVVFDGVDADNHPSMADWYFGGSNEYIGNGFSFYMQSSPPAGTYVLCADYEDYPDNGQACFGTVCSEVHIIGSEDDCYTTDCVFPGDANRDETANIYDLLPIGVHYNEKGAVRENASTNWYGQICQNWSTQTFNGINLKHLDCDGDGTISEADTEAILLNYNNLHDGVNPLSSNVNDPPVYLDFIMDSMIVDADNPGFINMTAFLMVGSPEIPAHNLHGLALSIDYPEDFVVEGSMVVSPVSQSFLCNPSNILTVYKETEDGFLDLAISRTNGIDASGFGAVAKVDFTIIGDIVVNRSPDEVEVPFGMEVEGVQGVNAYGGPTGTSPRSSFMTFHVDRSSGMRDVHLGQMKIGPIPANRELFINFGTINAENINVFSANGQRLASIQDPNNNTQINVGHMPEGVYILQIETEEGTLTKRFVIAR